MPQVAEKIDERILKILGLKDTFDLDYSDYSSLLKEKLAANRIKKVLSADEDKLILDEFKRVKSKTGSFKGTKKKIGADAIKTETKKPVSGYYKSPFAKEQAARQQAVKPNAKVTALSTYVDRQAGQKISPGALVKKDSAVLAKPIVEQSKKITKVANILESTQKQDQKIESEKKKDRLIEKDEQKKRDIESKIEKKIELPNLTKLADPILKPVKGIFQRILEAFGWLATGWLVDKAIVWISDPSNQEKIDNVKEWFEKTKEKLESPESQKRFQTITKFLREHWLAIFGSAGVMLLWSNGLVRFSVKLLASIGKATLKIGVAAGKMLANLAIRNPAAAAAFAAATAGLYLANKDKVDKAASPYLKGAKDFAEGAVNAGKTAVQKGSEFVDAGDKLFKVGKYSEDYGKNTGGVIGLNSGGTVPVMLTRGEVVVPPNKARQIGYNNLYAMNALGNRRNEGGPILPFNSGGGVKVIPGRGPNVDSVRDRLPVGSFVLQRPAVDAMGGPRAFRGYNSGGAVNTVAHYGTPSQRALLDTISFAEGTYTKNREEGYKIMFTGKRFSAPPWKHPEKINKSGRYKSDAAGRYQFLSTTWKGLNLPDFTPANQDRGALKLAEGRNKTIWSELESKGLTDNIMNKMSGIWASFPTLSGASAYGQPVKNAKKLRDVYKKNLAGAGPGTGTYIANGTNATDQTSESNLGVSATGSGSSPLDFFGLVRSAIQKISGANSSGENSGKNKGGLIQLLNKGGVSLTSNGGRPLVNKRLEPGKTYTFDELKEHSHNITTRTVHDGIQMGPGKDYGVGKLPNFMPSGPNGVIPTPQAGEVLRAGDVNNGYGKSVVIKGPLGPMGFHHLSNFGSGIKQGGRVSIGQIIGTQGKTGGNYAEHLHLNASPKGHEAFVNYVTTGKPTTGSAAESGSDIGEAPEGPGSGFETDTEDSAASISGTPFNFFSAVREAVNKIGGTGISDTSDSKLKSDIKKITSTPPSRSKPQSTVSSDMMTLPADVVKTGKSNDVSSIKEQLPKPTQKTPVPSVPTTDMSVVNPHTGGFQWSYAEYYGIK